MVNLSVVHQKECDQRLMNADLRAEHVSILRDVVVVDTTRTSTRVLHILVEQTVNIASLRLANQLIKVEF